MPKKFIKIIKWNKLMFKRTSTTITCKLITCFLMLANPNLLIRVVINWLNNYKNN